MKRLWLALCCVGMIFARAAPAKAQYPIGYDQRYIDAVDDSKFGGGPTTDYWLDPAKRVSNLTVITDANPNLTWKEGSPTPQGHVLMTMFTDFTGYRIGYADNTGRGETWLAAAPELQNFLKANVSPFGDAALRTKQLMGMPANHPGDRVIEVWVRRDDMTRPCKDPDVTNPVSPLDWPEHADKTWFSNNWNYNFVTRPSQGKTPYPWTGLGYTYDWGSSEFPHQGLTEFIAPNFNPADPARTTVEVYSVISIGSYPYYSRDTGNFHVTGFADTIWAGDRYTPLGDSVYVGPDGILYQGITVSSPGYTITNQGTLLGPGRNVDNSLRNAVVEFEAGGRIDNSGRIAGPVGVGALAGDTTVNNSGTIEGSLAAIRTAGGNDRITTSGTIRGNVETGAGNDTVTIGGGSLIGDLDGGGDDDSLAFDVPSGQTFTAQGDVRNFEHVDLIRGIVSLNGTVAFPDLVVGQGATLGGSLTVQGNLTTHGVLSPGNSIGTVHVAGNYTQGPTGRLVIDVMKPGAGTFRNDNLTVDGAADLQSGTTIEVRLAPGSRDAFRTQEQFTIISTGSDFPSPLPPVQFQSTSEFLRFSGMVPSWMNRRIYRVQVTRTASFASAVDGGNATALASALDADADLATGDFASLVDDLLFMSRSQFRQAVEGLTPAPYAAVPLSAQRMAEHQASAISDYLRNRRAGQGPCRAAGVSPPGDVGSPASSGDVPLASAGDDRPGDAVTLQTRPADDRGGFAESFGTFLREDSGLDRAGFRANSVGTLFGVDRRLSDGAIAGIGGAYSRTDLRFSDGRGGGNVDAFRFGPYVTLYDEQCFMDASLTAGFHDNLVHRNVAAGQLAATARGDYGGFDFSPYVAAGYGVPLGIGTLWPTASLEYVYYRQREFTESAGGGAELHLPAQTFDFLRSKLGMELTGCYQWKQATVLADVFGGWAHQYMADDPLWAEFAAAETPFATQRTAVFRNSAYFGAALTITPRANVSLFCRYKGEVASAGLFQTCDAGLFVAY